VETRCVHMDRLGEVRGKDGRSGCERVDEELSDVGDLGGDGLMFRCDLLLRCGKRLLEPRQLLGEELDQRKIIIH